MAEIDANTVINLIGNYTVSNTIRICAIKAASAIELPTNDNDLKKLLKAILDTPYNTVWLNSIMHYVIINNPNINWLSYANYSNETQSQITAACTTAIKKITGTAV